VAVSPTKSKRGYVSTTLYQHQSTLRLMIKGLGVTSFPSDAATAPDMSEFFTPWGAHPLTDVACRDVASFDAGPLSIARATHGIVGKIS